MTSNRPTRVLLWSPKGSSEQYHGPGSFAYRLYSLADREQTHVTLVHGSSHQPRVDLYRDQHYIKGGRGVAGSIAFLRHSKTWLSANAKQYDVFHGLVAYHPTIVPAYHAHQLGLPSVVFIATHRAELIDKPGIRKLLGWPRKRRRLIRELDGVISMSTAIYEELIECRVEPRKIARIPMGVNTDRFRPVDDANEQSEIRGELGLPDRPTLLFVGAVVRGKRPHLLVQAVGRLVSRGKDIQLVIAGPTSESDYFDEIIELIRQDDLDEHVKLVGFTEQIERYHRASDIFALPSRREGMPAALVEAMSSGLACMGTSISGITDLIDDGVNGFVVQPDVDSIVDALTKYVDDPSLVAKHGQQCRARILKSYGAEAVLNAYLDLFQCVIDGRDASDASILPEIG